MKFRLLTVAAALIASTAPVWAERDFLTPEEVEKVREAQEPNDRLKLYVLFARERIDEFQKLMAKEKKGRSILARDLLEDYTHIIEAIDTVSDDALRRKVDISLATQSVQTSERNFAGTLRKIYDSGPADRDIYHVAFEEAMATTLDSLDASTDATPERGNSLSAKDEKAKKDAESILQAEDSKGQPPPAEQSADNKPADPNNPTQPRRKPPTLLKPGETIQ
jgi:hypothetical protein